MRRGFLTGLTAVLVLTVFLSFFALQQAKTSDQVFGLLQQEAFRVHQRFLDGARFANETIKDGLLDTAVAAHGCIPAGNFCSQLSARLTSYLDGSSKLLSQDGLKANFSATVLSCAQVPSDPGFDLTFFAKSNLTGFVTKSKVTKQGSFLNDWSVLVNTTSRRLEVRSGIKVRNVRLSCSGVVP